MAKLPNKGALSGPVSLRSGRMISSADMSGIGRGLASLGNSLAQIGAEESKQQSIVDVARAEAQKTQQFLDTQNAFDNDGDYSTFRTRAEQSTRKTVTDAAGLIRDPETRARWTAQANIDAIRTNDGIVDRGSVLRRQAETNALDDALEVNRRLYVSPVTPEDVKDKARREIIGAIEVAGEAGLLTPDQVDARKKSFVDGADFSRAELEAAENPGVFLGAEPSVGFGNPNLPAGMRNNNPGNIKYVGQGRDRGVIGPSQNTDQGDPQAVFSTPEEGMREAYRLARTKYDGGKTTANDLIAGEGGWTPGNLAAAANIAKSMGIAPTDDLNLSDPASAQKFMRALVTQEHGTASGAYSDAMISNAIGGGRTEDLPVITKGASLTGRSFDPDLNGIKPEVMTRFKAVQNAFGKSIPVVSGFRDVNRNKRAGGAKSSQHIHGSALDLDVSDMSQDERIALIKTARANGFGGIGVYGNSIHIDTGSVRAWGPSHGSESLPAWAKEAVNTPVGKSSAPTSNTPAYYSNLSPENQKKIRDQAQAEQNRRNVETRANIEVTTANAPTAIFNTGKYDNPLPTQEQFMSAYGAAEGAERFNKFQASVETSRQAFDMQTMSSAAIGEVLETAKPASSGDNTALEQSRYETLSKAAEATLKAREADPAAYARQAFPSVRQAWTAVDQPGGFQASIAASVAAQTQLGISNIQPLPNEIAKTTVDVFKDETLGEAERIGAVANVLMATEDAGQRKAIFNQMVKEGLPDVTEGAFTALSRGDTGAANRLFRAALIDPAKLPGQAPFKPSDIDEAVQSQLMAEGEIGDIYYGLSDGTVENFETAQRDSKLLNNAVNIRVRNGEALETAVTSAAKDLYGDVKAVTGDGRVNAQILLSSKDDPEPVLEGLSGLMPRVREAVMQTLAVPDDVAGTARAITDAATSNYASTVLSQGYFRNAGDGYVFIDPTLGEAIPGPDGEPLIFTLDDVTGAVRQRDTRAPEAPLTDDSFDAFQKRMQGQ